MGPPLEKLMLDWIEARRDDLIHFAADLVATPSPNLPGDERAVAERILAEMRKLGLDNVETVARDPARPNLICRVAGAGAGPTLMLAGHSDTKPVGDSSGWDTDPLTPTIREGRLYGLGATDMKGAVAAMVYAAATLSQAERRLRGSLMLVINADEERSMRSGSEYLAAEYGLKADAGLLGEPSAIRGEEFAYLHLVSHGMACFRIRVRGTQMHSSLSARLHGINAGVKLAQVLARMNDELQLTFTPHPLCPAPTVNLGVRLEGGVGYGVLPGLAEFQAEVRLIPGMSRDQLYQDLEQCLARLRRDDPELLVEFVPEQPPLEWRPATEVPREHPLVGALLTASERVLGRHPELSAFPGTTDAINFQQIAGIPTIPSFGPGWLDLAHGPNECVGVEAIVQAAKLYAEAAALYLGAS